MAKRQAEERLSREAWEEAALEAVAEEGLAAVAVEPLARRLGVTKGSFYWHFESREALLEAALRRWERLHTEEVIASLRDVKDPHERLERLALTRLDRAGRLYTALSGAADDPRVRAVLRRVSDRRVGYLAECFAALGLEPEAAHHRALLTYAAYVGLQHLERESQGRVLSKEERGRYFTRLMKTLIPP